MGLQVQEYLEMWKTNSQFDPFDILDAVAPTYRNQSYAEVEIFDLTFMRCNYTFVYHLHIQSDIYFYILEIQSEDLPTAPKQPHLIYAGKPDTMKVMYVSSSTNPPPMVKYWKWVNSEDTGWFMASNI